MLSKQNSLAALHISRKTLDNCPKLLVFMNMLCNFRTSNCVQERPRGTFTKQFIFSKTRGSAVDECVDENERCDISPEGVPRIKFPRFQDVLGICRNVVTAERLSSNMNRVVGIIWKYPMKESVQKGLKVDGGF